MVVPSSKHVLTGKRSSFVIEIALYLLSCVRYVTKLFLYWNNNNNNNNNNVNNRRFCYSPVLYFAGVFHAR